MADSFRTAYLDSCVYICAMKGKGGTETDEHVDIAQNLILDAQSKAITLVACTAVLTEVVKDPTVVPNQPNAPLSAIDNFFRQPMFSWVEVDMTLAIRARDLMWENAGLKSMDAIHLAAAERGKADVFMTWDERPLKVGSVGKIPIVEPYPLPGGNGTQGKLPI